MITFVGIARIILGVVLGVICVWWIVLEIQDRRNKKNAK
jgi:ABC-type lipoprotein release transport system permease subunit